jgi:alcohol dehydrogenase
MNMEFTYCSPTRIVFQAQAVANSATELSKLGRFALIVTGRASFRNHQAWPDLTAALASVNIRHELFSGVESNPGWATVDAGANAGRRAGADFVIGIGGGSAIDAAKAIAALMANPGMSARDFFEHPPDSALPIVAIPTTAGTGTEVTPIAVLTSQEHRTKRALKNNCLYPSLALVDARYTHTLSAETTLDTAVDAWSHLIEGYLAVKAQPVSDALAEKGLALFGSCLEALRKRSWDEAIRERLMLASTLGGLVIAAAGTATVHALGFPLTYFKQITHGRANGFLLAAHLRKCATSGQVEAKLNALHRLCGLADGEALEAFLGDLFPDRPGLTLTEIRDFASYAVSSRNHENNPYPVDETVLAALLRESLRQEI